MYSQGQRFRDLMGQESMGSGFNGQEIDPLDLIDERSVRSEVRSLSNTRSLDKMLNVFYQVKSTRDKVDIMESQSMGTLNGPSLGSMVSSTSLSQILLPVESIKKFDMRCWDAFFKYSRPVGDLPLDKCERGLPVFNLFNALDFISDKVRKMNVEDEIERFYLQPDDTIPWSEFKYFCDSLFEPVLDGKRKKPVEWNRPGLPSTPYTQMLRKARTVGQLSYADLAGRTSGSTLIKANKFRDVLITQGEVGDALLRTVRKVGDKHAQSLTRSMHTEPSRLLAPLQKSTVLELANPTQSTYAEKWLDMREKRALRKASIGQRAARKNAMSLMARQVVNQDRASMRTVLEHKEVNVGKEVKARYSLSKKQQAQVSLNIKTWQQKNLKSKAQNASALKGAIESSMSNARSLLQEELLHKKETKAPSLKLPQYSSTMVEVPVELTDRMRFARREKEFRDAEKAYHRFIKEELDHRIKKHTKARFDAAVRTKRTGGHVTVAPLEGEDVFEDPTQGDDNMLYVDYNTYMQASNTPMAFPGGDLSLVDDSTFATHIGFHESPIQSTEDALRRSYSAAGDDAAEWPQAF